jgi:DNA-binding PadR family transcriptional regulator
VSRLFGHGDLRLWLLKLIDERPRHGYDIIAGLEEQFLGIYSPSPGTVYPRLSALEAEGLIEQVDTEDGRKVYRLTDAGRDELHARTDEVRELTERLTRSAREIARDIRDEVKSAVRDLRSEVRRAATEVRRDERRAGRVTRDAAREAREVAREAREAAREGSRAARDAARIARDAAREASTDIRTVWRSLQADLDGFVSDVVSAARRHDLNKTRLAGLRSALQEARAAIVEALERDGD